jgi:MoaA/NifB/PqqE/SkfB family radical SAM enzyme
MSKRHLQAAKMYLRATLGGYVQYLILYVTSRCNARCRMCFNWDGMGRRRTREPHTLPELTRLAASMRLLPQLTLSGGEPLLRDDLIEIIKAFYREAHTRFFTVPTNALLPHEVENLINGFTRECPDGFLNLCLPFHGTEKTHDDIMGVRGSYARRNETYTVIQEARKAHPNVSCVLNCVLSSFNHAEYKEIVDLAIGEFSAAPLGIAYARGKMHEKEAAQFPLESYKAMHEYLARRHTPKKGLNPYTRIQEASAGQYRDTVSGVIEGRITRLNCRAGTRLLVVFDDGSVYPCETLETLGACPSPEIGNACMGNLHDFDYDLARLLDSEQAARVTHWIRTHACACTWECAVTSHVVHSPAQVARLGLNIARETLAAPRKNREKQQRGTEDSSC